MVDQKNKFINDLSKYVVEEGFSVSKEESKDRSI